jgi:hypothetical protein
MSYARDGWGATTSSTLRYSNVVINDYGNKPKGFLSELGRKVMLGLSLLSLPSSCSSGNFASNIAVEYLVIFEFRS